MFSDSWLLYFLFKSICKMKTKILQKFEPLTRPNAGHTKTEPPKYMTKRAFTFVLFCLYLVCVKRITPCNCLCFSSCYCFSASRVRNIRASHIRDFRPCRNVKSHVCPYFLIPPEKDSAVSENNSSVMWRLSLEKSCLLFFCSAVQKLNKI